MSRDTSQHRRRRLQFGLRSLLLFVLLSSLGLSWLAVKLRQAERQRRVVAQIESDLDAIVFYDGSRRDFVPSCLERWLGIDFFLDVASVYTTNESVTDGDLACLADLNRLTSLELNNLPIDGSGLVYSRNWAHSLKQLHLSGTRLNDSEMQHLAQYRKLEYVDLSMTQIGDSGLLQLGEMSELKYLNLTATNITDKGMQWIVGLSRLEHLGLSGTKLTGGGLKSLHFLVHLKELEM